MVGHYANSGFCFALILLLNCALVCAKNANSNGRHFLTS